MTGGDMFVVDSKGVVTEVPGGISNSEASTRSQRSSARKIRANRRNARSSTGPRTDAGKTASSRNALTHGGLSSGLEPILKGPFAEDPEEYRQTMERRISSFGPRDQAELDTARQIAGCSSRLDRINLLEVASIESSSRASAGNVDASPEAVSELEELVDAAWRLSWYLAGIYEGPVDYSMFAILMRRMGPRPGVSIEALWDTETTPKTDDDWVRAFNVLREQLWESELDARVWAHELAARLSRKLEALEGLDRERASNRILKGAMEQVTRYTSRTINDLMRLVGILERLQERPPSALGPNEAKE
jgi:hypothetical protein